MTKAERLRFAKLVLEELSAAGDGDDKNPIRDLLWLSLYSPDTKARLASIRALALELEADAALEERQLARWTVIKIAPKAKAA